MEIPSHSVIINRGTGSPVGPATPINPKDWPYSTIPPSEILWRYMDFKKLEDLLVKSAFFFARGDRFRDPFEGRYSPGNASRVSLSEQALHAAYPIKRDLKEAMAAHEVHRSCVFISCWHRNTKEDRIMWKAYTATSESVVITTSAKALYRFLPETITKSPVKYHDLEFPRTDFGWHALFFYKPSGHQFEHEFRLLRSLGEDESVSIDDAKDYGRYVPVPLKKVIHRVITHPQATPEFKAKVETVLWKNLKRIKREDSALL